MKNIFFILTILILSNATAKEFSITNGRLNYSLTLNKHTRFLAVKNYLNFKDMGALTVLEEGTEGRSDNFLRDLEIHSGEKVEVQGNSNPIKKLDKEAFFECIVRGERLYSYELIQNKLQPSNRGDLLLELDSCEKYLSSEYVFPDRKNIFFFTSIVKNLDKSSDELVRDLFLGYLDINLNANEKFARESLLTMISYDTQFNSITSIDLVTYKKRLKDEILLSTSLIKEDIESKTESVIANFIPDELIRIVEEI